VRSNVLISLIFVSLCAACSGREQAAPSLDAGTDSGPDYDPSVLTVPFAVDDHYIPSGCIGDCAASVTIDSNCPSRGVVDAQGECHHFVYSVNTAPDALGWAGLLWQTDEKNWGSEQHWHVAPGATHVHFWAKGVVTSSTPGVATAPQITFVMGGINGDDTGKACDAGLSCASDACTNGACTAPYHDTLDLVKQETLGADAYSLFEIPFENHSYGSLVLSGFGWTVTMPAGASTIEFYVDDLRWE
jgi:hypothetical protein